MIIKDFTFKLMAIGLLGLPMLGHANVRGLTPSDGAASLLLSAVALLIGYMAITGAIQNFRGTGEDERSVGTGLFILVMGAFMSGSLAWIVLS